MMKIHVYYRHTPVVRATSQMRPSWFSHEVCFASLLRSLMAGSAFTDVGLTVVFDGSEADLDADFVPRYVALPEVKASKVGQEIRIQRITGGSQRAAGLACLDIIMADCQGPISEGDIIYYLENDYLHQPDWVQHVSDLARSKVKWDYLSLYDHGDKYPDNCDYIDARRYHHLKSKIFVAGSRHWRTVPSTCGTYLMRRDVFKRDKKYYALGLGDMRHFIFLTGLLGRTLLTPMPGLATHSMDQLLSPGIDWDKVAVDAAASFGRPVESTG